MPNMFILSVNIVTLIPIPVALTQIFLVVQAKISKTDTHKSIGFLYCNLYLLI